MSASHCQRFPECMALSNANHQIPKCNRQDCPGNRTWSDVLGSAHPAQPDAAIGEELLQLFYDAGAIQTNAERHKVIAALLARYSVVRKGETVNAQRSAPQVLAALEIAADAIRQADGGDPSTDTGWKSEEMLSAWLAIRGFAPGFGGEPMQDGVELSLMWRGRAQAFRILDSKRTSSDLATLAKAEAYEECATELRAAITQNGSQEENSK